DVAPVLKIHVPAGRGFAIAAGVAIAVGLALGAVHVSPHATIGRLVRKYVGVALVVLGIHAELVTLTRSELPGYSPDEWAARGSQMLADARAQHKPVLLDFGASWCAACKELELITYPHPTVANELKRFVFIKIDDEQGTVNPQYGGNGGLP